MRRSPLPPESSSGNRSAPTSAQREMLAKDKARDQHGLPMRAGAAHRRGIRHREIAAAYRPWTQHPFVGEVDAAIIGCGKRTMSPASGRAVRFDEERFRQRGSAPAPAHPQRSMAPQAEPGVVAALLQSAPRLAWAIAAISASINADLFQGGNLRCKLRSESRSQSLKSAVCPTRCQGCGENATAASRTHPTAQPDLRFSPKFYVQNRLSGTGKFRIAASARDCPEQRSEGRHRIRASGAKRVSASGVASIGTLLAVDKAETHLVAAHVTFHVRWRSSPAKA